MSDQISKVNFSGGLPNSTDLAPSVVFLVAVSDTITTSCDSLTHLHPVCLDDTCIGLEASLVLSPHNRFNPTCNLRRMSYSHVDPQGDHVQEFLWGD